MLLLLLDESLGLDRQSLTMKFPNGLTALVALFPQG
jgi:hypothetical protein